MGKLIVVTGGAGFVGSHLCERLHKDGHRVISLDNYFTGSRANHVPGVEYREGHTRNIEHLIPESPDIVYHLGEYSRTEKSFEDVETVWDLNKTGTFAVLEFVRRRGSKIVYAGSSTKFADEGKGRDQSPYAWSKATNTELVKNYGTWFGIPYAITYFYNVYGPRERAGAFGTVIEIFKQSYLAGRPIGITPPGTQERNFTHVEDIVDGLVLVGEKGEGDEFGLGDARAYSIQDVARMFGTKTIMLPERAGNRLTSLVDAERSYALGWKPTRHLETYIKDFLASEKPAPYLGNRILVFSTTFHPIEGPAERALAALMRSMPELSFDVITARYEKHEEVSMPQNVRVHRIGSGTPFDKFLLPILGSIKAKALMKEHSFLFAWSVMASYGAMAAVLARGTNPMPLLVTLADQRLTWYSKLFIRFMRTNTDQVYASAAFQENHLAPLVRRMRARKTVGTGDAFANQIRFAYTNFLEKELSEKSPS